MSVTADWSVVELGADPCPGDVERVRALASRLSGYADLAASNRDRLRAVAADVSGGPLRMRGDYAAGYAQQFVDLPDELGKLETAYRGCAGALGRFASRLDEAQGRARTALRAGVDAHDRFWSARRTADAVLPTGVTLPWGPHGVSLAQADAATTGLDETTRGQVRAAVTRAIAAKADQDRAARLARDAAALRGDAERACVREIDDALHGSGIANKSWLEKAWDTVSAPFRSWDDFVSLCETVALVAGIVALFVSGPIGWAIMAAALAAGAVILADTLTKYTRGQASLLDVGLGVLGVIPGGHGVLSAAKLAVGAKGLAVAVRAGGGKLLGAGAHGLRTAIPHGLQIAGGLRSAARNPALFARAATCRAFGADPIDLATGEMFTDTTDLQLPVGPGAPPVVVRRIHQSSYRVGHQFGPAWNTTLDRRLEIDDTGITYTGADGLVLLFPPAPDSVGVQCTHGPRLTLTRTATPDPVVGVIETYTVHDPVTDLTERYSAVGGVPGVTALPIVAVSDRAGRRTEYRYDPDGHLTSIVTLDAAGQTGYRVRVETVDGRIAALTVENPDPADAGETETVVARYGYDTAGRLTHVYNSSGAAMRYTYDDLSRITRWDDRNDTWYAYRYDEHGRCYAAEGTDHVLRARITYDTDPDGTTSARFTDSLGHTSVYTANDQHQIIRREDPLGGTWLQDWDDHNHLLASTDPLGRTTRYTYDPTGRPTSVTLPDGAVTTLDRDPTGLPTTATDPTGATWTSHYDTTRGLLLTQTDPTGATTTYTWDQAGHLTTITDPLGATTRVHCDPAGLPLQVTDPTGATTSLTRDPQGRPVTITDPTGATTHLAWTVEGHLRERTAPDGARWTWTYDAEGNLREATDPIGGTTRVMPTAWDQPAEITTPDGATTRYTYDTERRLTNVTNPLGLTWRYTYDPRGHLIAETDFDGRTTALTRDAAGQITRRENAAGVTDYERDLRGAVLTENASDTSGTATRTTFAYDPAGRLVQATNPDADVVLVRDALGRVVTETTTDPLGARTLTSQYDPAGRRTSRTTPSGTTSDWTYDTAGRPVTLTDGADPLLRFGYDPAGRPTSRTLGPDPTSAILDLTWNTSGLLATQTLTSTAGDPVLRRGYTYADDGYLTRIEDLTNTTSLVSTLTLDPLRRITTVTTGPGAAAEQYTYDAAGNITDAVWPGTDGTDGTDPDTAEGPRGTRKHTGTRVVQAGRTTYLHDDAGRLVTHRTRLLSGGTRTHTYTWDTHDRLTTCTTPNGTLWRYTYDALGRRTAKHRHADDGTIVESVVFTWDSTTLTEQTRTQTGTDPVVTTWDHTPDGLTPLTQRTRARQTDPPHDQAWHDEQFHAIITDLVGTPTHLITPDGTLAWCRRTTIWGAPLDAPTTETNVTCLLLFPGQYTDHETGLAYNYFRHYDPDTGRYTSTDHLGLFGSPNPATYVDNPTAWIDPLGLTPYTDQTSFYRAMSAKHFAVLDRTGLLRATGETFISPTRAFSEAYTGVLVKFQLRPGSVADLVELGVRDTHPLTLEQFPEMSEVFTGWNRTSAFFKQEGIQINIGLGRGAGLEAFNNAIVDFWRVR